jgi:uncharacterized protein YdeI (YjbR/CyaY-like superfamily)
MILLCLAVIEQSKPDGSWTIYNEIEDLVIPTYLLTTLPQNEAAECHFYAFSDSFKKNILWWIKSAKQPITRQKRIAETVQLTRHNVKTNHPEARIFDRHSNA